MSKSARMESFNGWAQGIDPRNPNQWRAKFSTNDEYRIAQAADSGWVLGAEDIHYEIDQSLSALRGRVRNTFDVVCGLHIHPDDIALYQKAIDEAPQGAVIEADAIYAENQASIASGEPTFQEFLASLPS